MHRRVRTILFFSFLAAFFVLAPILVLYTAGYRYNVQTGRVLQTGSIAVATRPRSSVIYLNSEETERSPHIFKRVLPGNYLVELVRKEYHTYKTSFELSPGESVDLQTVELLRDTKPELIRSIGAESADLHAGSESIAYIAREAGWIDGWIYNRKNDSFINVFRTPTAKDNGTIKWSKAGTHVAFFYGGVVRVYTNEGAQIQLSVIPRQPTLVYWHPTEDEVLYVRGETGMLELNVKTGEFTELPKETLFQSNGIRYSISIDQGTLNRHEGSLTEYLARVPQINFTLAAAAQDHVILQDDFDRIHIYQLSQEAPPIILPAISFDLIENDVVYTDGSDIRIYHLSSRRDELITRVSSGVSSVAWGLNGQHLFYATRNGVQAVERRPLGDIRYREELTDLSNISSIWIAGREQTLYLLRETEAGTELFLLRTK